MKEKIFSTVRKILTALLFLVIVTALILKSESTAQGIRDGLAISGELLIPSLFPFMVASSYATAKFSIRLPDCMGKLFKKAFKVNANGLLPFIFGITGGYPVGARTIYELYKNKQISGTESERLFFWCVNPGAAFTITALGTNMLGSTRVGIIIYASSVLSALTLGLVFGFFGNEEGEALPSVKKVNLNPSSDIISNATQSMLSVCGWVLCFSALSGLTKSLNIPESMLLFLQLISEITTGCRVATESSLSLPVISALTGFGGFAVICQCIPYLQLCHTQIKRFIALKVVNATLCSFFTYLLIKIFPVSIPAGAIITPTLSCTGVHTNIVAIIMLCLMFISLILEVDNRRKVW